MTPSASSRPTHRARRGKSLTFRITAALLLIGLIPVALASFIGVRRAAREIQAGSTVGLLDLAEITAARLDQLIDDTQTSIRVLALQDAVIALCAAAPEDRGALLAGAQRQVDLLIEADPEYHASAFVTDAAGIGLVSTHERNVGQDLTFREYWRRARGGELYVSDLLVGSRSGEQGMYFSSPVRAGPEIVGVAVLKLDGRAIQDIVRAVRVARDEEGRRLATGNQAPVTARDFFTVGHAVLTDEHGVILAHASPGALYRSIAPLPADFAETVDTQTLWNVDEVRPLGLVGLEDALQDPARPRVRRFRDPAGAPWIGAYATISAKPQWRLSVIEPQAQFARRMQTYIATTREGALVLALLAVILALWLTRRIIAPIRRVTLTAERIAAGDLDARVEVNTQDELGALARAFNAMAPKLRERLKLRESLELAREVQQRLLPEGAPQVRGLEIAGLSQSADETGGDYYDYLDLSQWAAQSVAIVVGDVTGHGVAPALLMATARGMLRSRATPPGPVGQLLTDVNARLCGDTSDGRFMTMLYMIVDGRQRKVRWASAGHDPAIWYRASSGAFEELEGGDIPLGIIAEQEFQEFARGGFEAGDLLVIGTDGVWEARSPEGVMFGKQRLRDLVRAHAADPVEAIARAVLEALTAFRGDGAQADDITLVVVRFAK
ncbi:MAG: SpoIIE family protein phosphatase [Phycisphaerales bacterium JB039]